MNEIYIILYDIKPINAYLIYLEQPGTKKF